jgi:hypothetical protein
MRTEIVVTLQHEAVHNWPGVVAHAKELEAVQYLQYPHRHMFHIRCTKLVNHNDRDVEIIDFKQRILCYMEVVVGKNMQATSCEMLAADLLNVFGLASCEVLEDGENGAIVYA